MGGGVHKPVFYFQWTDFVGCEDTRHAAPHLPFGRGFLIFRLTVVVFATFFPDRRDSCERN
jgi:hypothetical protein